MQSKKLFARPIAVMLAVLMLAAIISGPAHAIGGGRGAPPNLGMVDVDWDFDPIDWDMFFSKDGFEVIDARRATVSLMG